MFTKQALSADPGEITSGPSSWFLLETATLLGNCSPYAALILEPSGYMPVLI